MSTPKEVEVGLVLEAMILLAKTIRRIDAKPR